MFSKLIYELIKVYVYDYIDDSEHTRIDCHSCSSGFFDSILSVESFIKKHNPDKNCFFIARSHVFNPTHRGQTEDYLTERTYDCHGNTICDCSTHHFVVNFKEMFSEKPTRFTGRDNLVCEKNEIAWFYDEHDDILQKCEISEVPFNKKRAKKFECLDYYDDSYLVYPLPKPETDNHQHITSCFIFNDEQIKNMMCD